MKRHFAFLLSLLLGAGSALAQSGQTINQLSPGAALQGTEQIPMYQAANPAVTTTPSAVATYALGSPRSGLNDWVNIKDPRFGATGNGSTDDTAAIQAAIDYAFANNLHGIYCPVGNYTTTNTIYLDPPGNLRSNLSNPTNSAFSMSFFGDPAAAGDYQGCRIQTTTNDFVAFMVGPGQGMRVSDIAVMGGGGGYRGNLPLTGVGVGLTGGSAGSSINLVENTYVSSFYALYKTNANGAGSLNDSNTFRKIAGDNGYYGIYFAAAQTDINDVVEPRLGYTTIMIDSEFGRQVNVYGGNLSSTNSVSNSFTMGKVSAFAKTTDGGGYDYSFTATLSGGSPSVGSDPYIGRVYNAFTIPTAHFGVIPLIMTNWNSQTDVATFEIRPQWSFANYGTADLTTNTDLQAEVAAVTIVYAVERDVVFQGSSITSDGVHVENPNACTSLYMAQNTGGAASATSTIRNPYFNFDPAMNGAPAAYSYCQQTFPFIGLEFANGTNAVSLEGGNYTNGTSSARVLLEGSYPSRLYGSHLSNVNGLPSFNVSFADNTGYAYGQLYSVGGSYAGATWQTTGRGFGFWDNNYFVPAGLSGTAALGNDFSVTGELASPYCGYEPCPWTVPNLSPTVFALVCPRASGGGSYGTAYTCGALGALGSYPPIACRTVFKSVDWNTAGISAGIFKRSASCPGYSWGQNLTDATVGETVTWSYKGQSDLLYLDAKALSWMFPGLGISIDNGSGAAWYTVTGVYPSFGYITVMSAGSIYGGPLAGTKTTVYSCASSCTIGQAPFAWTAY